MDGQNQAMERQVNAMILSWRAVDEHVDVAHRTGIKAEITQLLHGYARKRQSLSAAGSSSSLPAWSPPRGSIDGLVRPSFNNDEESP